MERYDNASFIVLSQAEIDARLLPFDTKQFVINSTHKELVVGPGLYADCQVLIPRGAGGGANANTLEVLVLKASNVQGVVRYLRSGSLNGKPNYVRVDDPNENAQWVNGYFEVLCNGDSLLSTDDVADPGEVTTWVSAIYIETDVAMYVHHVTTVQEALELLGLDLKRKTINGVYEASLTQNGTAAPVALVYTNTTDGLITWTRDDVGTYVGTFATPIDVAKSGVMIGSPMQFDPLAKVAFTGATLEATQVVIDTGYVNTNGAATATSERDDDVLSHTMIKLVLRA